MDQSGWNGIAYKEIRSKVHTQQRLEFGNHKKEVLCQLLTKSIVSPAEASYPMHPLFKPELLQRRTKIRLTLLGTLPFPSDLQRLVVLEIGCF